MKQYKIQKKVVLFIVEGRSDRTALERIFKKLYQYDKNITFEFTNGDITSNSNISVENVLSSVEKIVSKFKADNKLKNTDFYNVVQIYDMDGAYISDDCIEESDDGKHYFYTPTKIITNYKKIGY